MKNRYINIILVLIMFQFICSADVFQKPIVNTCITNKNFNQLKAFVAKNGTSIKLCKRVISDTVILSKEVDLADKYIELIEGINYTEIILIDKQNKIHTYFLILKNGKLSSSALYSILETKEDLVNRNNDFCDVINSLVAKKKTHCR